MLLAGANSIFIGEKLLTAPNRALDSDEELLRILQLEPKLAGKKTPLASQQSVNDEHFLQAALEKREQEGNKRFLSREDGSLIDLTSNDYLGLARSIELSQKIDAEYQKLVSDDGIRPHVGSTGSRLLTGNRDYVEHLERRLRAFIEPNRVCFLILATLQISAFSPALRDAPIVLSSILRCMHRHGKG